MHPAKLGYRLPCAHYAVVIHCLLALKPNNIYALADARIFANAFFVSKLAYIVHVSIPVSFHSA